MFYFPLNRLDNEAAGKGGNTEVRDSSVPHSPLFTFLISSDYRVSDHPKESSGCSQSFGTKRCKSFARYGLASKGKNQ